MSNHVTTLEIDTKALDHNLNYFKNKLKPETKILAVVKAFGYGSDGVLIANHLKDKVDYFAVAYADEGIALRKNGIENPIMVLHPQIQNFERIVEYKLEPSLYNFKSLTKFIELARSKLLLNYPIHLKFNTGLNRLGFYVKDVADILSNIQATNHVSVISILSHLAASEDENERDFTETQIALFQKIATKFSETLGRTTMLHTLNTSGVVNYPEAQFDMVRIGIGLFGFGNDPKETKNLKNSHVLKSIISQIHSIKEGETVGYNRAFKAKKFTKTATIPIGHADGISRKLGNKKGYVTINGKKAEIVGNVCMDMIMVDVSTINCEEGDAVYIIKSQKDVLHMAKVSETISYEILTAISQRVKRILKY